MVPPIGRQSAVPHRPEVVLLCISDHCALTELRLMDLGYLVIAQKHINRAHPRNIPLYVAQDGGGEEGPLWPL